MATEKMQIEGTHRETSSVWRRNRHRRGLRPCDQALDPTHEPPFGAHMVTPRRGYTHHGIYVGRNRVVQYGGLSHGLRRGPVEEGFAVGICAGMLDVGPYGGVKLVRPE